MSKEILHQPPLDEAPLKENGKWSENFMSWLRNIHSAVVSIAPPVSLNTVQGKTMVALSQAAQLTTQERDNLENIPNGTFIYNTTTQQFNFRENDAWVTK